MTRAGAASLVRRCSRRVWLLLVVLGLGVIPPLAALHSRSFFSPDEANYAQVAREMLETGEFLVPHRDGEVWLNKPPLAHWLLALGFALLGWGFPAAVVVNALLTALTAWLVARHAARRSLAAGYLAGAVYLSMFLPAFVARSALTDATLTFCTTAAVMCVPSQRRGSALAAGACLGLGLLAKGPVAPLVVVPAMLAATLATRERRAWRRLAVVLLSSTAVVAPWLAALASRGVLGAFVAQFLGHEVLSRAVDEWSIAAPAWVVLPMVWAGAFPWGTHLLAPLLAGWRGGTTARWWTLPRLAEAAAVVVPLLAFAMARGKLPHYVLPVLPFLAVWLGEALSERVSGTAPRWERAVDVLAGLGGAAALLVVAREVTAHPVAAFLPPWFPLALQLAAVSMLAVAGLAWARWRRAVVALLLGVGLGGRVLLDVAVVPFLESGRGDRPVAEAVVRHLPAGGVPMAHRWFREAYLAYGVRGWRRTDNEEALAQALAEARGAARVPLVVADSASEGEVRAVAWRAGGEARQLFRITGLVERHFAPVAVAGFAVDSERSGVRFFSDFDHDLADATGFWEVEGNRFVGSFRWTVAPVAELRVRVPREAWLLRLRGWGIPHQAVPQELTVAVGGCRLGTVKLGTLAAEFAFDGSVCPVLEGDTVASLAVRHLARPVDELPGSEDRRALGAALDWLAIEPAAPETVLTPGIRGDGE